MLLGTQPRQPRLHAVEGLTVGEPLPLLRAPRLRPRELRRARLHLFGGQQLAHREDPRIVDADRRALIRDRELREPIDFIAPQVDADRVVGGRRVDVDDGAAHGKLTARLHLVLAAVAHRDELLDEPVTVELLAGAGSRPGSNASTCGPRRCTSARTGATTTAGRWSPPARRRQITRSRRPIVSIAGETRSNGSVSHAGNSSTESGARNSRRSAARRSASMPVGTASTTGRRAVAVAKRPRREQRACRFGNCDQARAAAVAAATMGSAPSSVVSPARAEDQSCQVMCGRVATRDAHAPRGSRPRLPTARARSVARGREPVVAVHRGVDAFGQDQLHRVGRLFDR